MVLIPKVLFQNKLRK